MCHLPILVYLMHHRLHVNIKRPKKETRLSSHIFNKNAGNMTSGKPKSGYQWSWLVPFNIHQPWQKASASGPSSDMEAWLAKDQCLMTCPGFAGDGVATFGGFETCGLHIFLQMMFLQDFPKKNIFFSDRQVKFTSESDDSSDCWIVSLQKSYQRHDSLDIVRKNPDLCNGTFWKKIICPRPPCLGEKLHWNVKLTLVNGQLEKDR